MDSLRRSSPRPFWEDLTPTLFDLGFAPNYARLQCTSADRDSRQNRGHRLLYFLVLTTGWGGGMNKS
jgi:hypothetical protein